MKQKRKVINIVVVFAFITVAVVFLYPYGNNFIVQFRAMGEDVGDAGGVPRIAAIGRQRDDADPEHFLLGGRDRRLRR